MTSSTDSVSSLISTVSASDPIGVILISVIIVFHLSVNVLEIEVESFRELKRSEIIRLNQTYQLISLAGPDCLLLGRYGLNYVYTEMKHKNY